MLVPVEPLVGGFIPQGTAGVAANLALPGGALFVLLGLTSEASCQPRPWAGGHTRSNDPHKE